MDPVLKSTCSLRSFLSFTVTLYRVTTSTVLNITRSSTINIIDLSCPVTVSTTVPCTIRTIVPVGSIGGCITVRVSVPTRLKKSILAKYRVYFPKFADLNSSIVKSKRTKNVKTHLSILN